MYLFAYTNFIDQFISGILNTRWQEFVAVVFGIVSVLYSRKENILVFPTGIISTVLYTWFCFFWWNLYAEGSLNFYYTAMSVYGWWIWSKKTNGTAIVPISKNNSKDWTVAILFFFISFLLLYFILQKFTSSDVPLADSFASATAYTGMWQMARKKLENWIWWICTNIASIPLYFYKGAVFTSFQYVVLLVLAIMGFIEWNKKLNNAKAN
ncbi:MAG: nicotinamide riboside transporter PnuC [Chitinophagaceae bacterium]